MPLDSKGPFDLGRQAKIIEEYMYQNQPITMIHLSKTFVDTICQGKSLAYDIKEKNLIAKKYFNAASTPS